MAILIKGVSMSDFLSLSTLLFRVPALLIALSLHEYAHAAMSDSLGDPTPSAMGRLTVNPLAHLDILGTILLVICGFGWAKPVMVNPNYYKDWRKGTLLVSFAGPGMNLFIGFLCVLLMVVLFPHGYQGQAGAQLLFWILEYNVWFAFFNLIPVPPMDGSKIVSSFLPGEMAWKFENFSAQYGFLILMGLVFTGLVSRIINPLAGGFISLCYLIVSPLSSLFY